MAKKAGKNIKKNFKKLFSEYKSKAMDILGEFLQEQAGSLVEMLKGLLKIKQMVKKMLISVISGLAAAVVLLLGISGVLAMYFTNISEAWWQVIVGAVVIAFVAIYNK